MNTDADALSLYPTSSTSISSEAVQTVYNSIQVQQHIINIAETLETFDIIEATEFPGQPLAQLELKELRRSQSEVPLIRFRINAVKGITPPVKHKVPKGKYHLGMLKNFNNLKLIRGVLYLHYQSNLYQQLLPDFTITWATQEKTEHYHYYGRNFLAGNEFRCKKLV
jgi:hypothetical protein